MRRMKWSVFEQAQRFVGMKEIPGQEDNPAILAMLQLDMSWPQSDEVPWCSAFANYCAWCLRRPRSKDLRARSWLRVGAAILLSDAEPGFDVVILQRGEGEQPGPEVISAPGHVGFFAGLYGETVMLLGGNQGDAVTVAPFPANRVLGTRRLA